MEVGLAFGLDCHYLSCIFFERLIVLKCVFCMVDRRLKYMYVYTFYLFQRDQIFGVL